jgi:hypothetical protein
LAARGFDDRAKSLVQSRYASLEKSNPLYGEVVALKEAIAHETEQVKQQRVWQQEQQRKAMQAVMAERNAKDQKK